MGVANHLWFELGMDSSPCLLISVLSVASALGGRYGWIPIVLEFGIHCQKNAKAILYIHMFSMLYQCIIEDSTSQRIDTSRWFGFQT